MKNKKIPNRFDLADKRLMERPDLVLSILQDFVEIPLPNDLTPDDLILCDPTYSTMHGRELRGDKLWKIILDDKEVYLYILMELQSKPDKMMPLRILDYSTQLLKRLKKDNTDGELPPIFALVLYRGKEPWNIPLSVQDITKPVPESLDPYQIKQKYYLIDERFICSPNLEKTDSLAALYFRLLLTEDKNELADILNDLESILQYDFRADPDDPFMDYIYTCLHPELLSIHSEEENITAEQNYQTWRNDMNINQKILKEKMDQREAKGRAEGIEQGLEQGLEQGRQEGAVEIIKKILANTGKTLEECLDMIGLTGKEREQVKAMSL